MAKDNQGRFFGDGVYDTPPFGAGAFDDAPKPSAANHPASNAPAAKPIHNEHPPETVLPSEVAPAKPAAAEPEKEVEKALEKEEGFWRGLVNRGKKNLGGEAWKEAPVKTGFRAGLLAVSVGAILDATFRSKTKDENGNEIDRSGAARAGEGLLGLVVAGGSTLIGGGKGK